MRGVNASSLECKHSPACSAPRIFWCPRIPTLRQAFIREIGYIVLNTLTLFYLIYLVVGGQHVGGVEMTTLPDQILAAAYGFYSRSSPWLPMASDGLSMTSSQKR